ncbi:PREDICTED: 46 kDa FK506-binding nuclear protein-like [Eufriesea mexicana]|uniref:46 kDa FK506-binding nuclear protein-like n=1 Tax=Eufriesea mexicana TaxID=516756 RepID=UPI00083C2F6C|nr:PREDICTED: 46 kDa FK506-binding nuclear protein-like [Eufriesea mexicana]
MFWGLILEPNKRYTQTVEKSFHVSMASLNLQTSDDNVVQVMLYYEDSSYLLCNLKKSSTWQVPLDLNFQEGTTIAFICHGHGQVHLTGYLIPEDLDLDELEEEEDDEESPQLVDKQSKRKAIDSLKNEKNVKRPKQEIEPESSDEDIELDGMNEDNDSDDSEEEEESLLNEDSEEGVEGEEDDEEDEEEEKKIKLQQKDKKNKQQKKKEDKKKLVNGKEVKQKKSKGEHQQNEVNIQNDQKKRIVEGGVQIEEIKVGNGPFAKSGKFVSVYYVGRLKNGKKFDSTTQGDGFKFRLGREEVIKGWDIGIVGMKVGGKRRIIIPPAMAYGAKGSPPVIPGNSTLVFEVELRNVH